MGDISELIPHVPPKWIRDFSDFAEPRGVAQAFRQSFSPLARSAHVLALLLPGRKATQKARCKNKMGKPVNPVSPFRRLFAPFARGTVAGLGVIWWNLKYRGPAAKRTLGPASIAFRLDQYLLKTP